MYRTYNAMCWIEETVPREEGLGCPLVVNIVFIYTFNEWSAIVACTRNWIGYSIWCIVQCVPWWVDALMWLQVGLDYVSRALYIAIQYTRHALSYYILHYIIYYYYIYILHICLFILLKYFICLLNAYYYMSYCMIR